MTKDELREKANDLPLQPGVYLMMDKTGKVIYVGKAKKLKNRVSQYFHAAATPSIARARSPSPMTKSRIASSVGMTRRAHSRAASFSSNLRI